MSASASRNHWLADRQRAAVHEAIAAYAAEHAGTSADLDPTLAAAAVEHLLELGRGLKLAQDLPS